MDNDIISNINIVQILALFYRDILISAISISNLNSRIKAHIKKKKMYCPYQLTYDNILLKILHSYVVIPSVSFSFPHYLTFH